LAAGQLLLWGDGNEFTIFGANQSVIIDIGTIRFECDDLWPTANVYVVKAGTVHPGSALTDVSGGGPNTIVAATGGIFVAVYRFTLEWTLGSSHVRRVPR
jgi:hypothetical protein